MCVAAFILARVLTQEALRPLVAVNAALERFATGDLTPQLVSTDNRGDLGALARAYNGAIAQMALAFAERDRAESAMHQFIADAGHQLKTPLTVIRGFISVLRKGDLRSADDYERILEKMNRQSLVMGALVEKLILLEHWERAEEPLDPIAIDVAQFVEDVVAPFAEAQPSRQHFARHRARGFGGDRPERFGARRDQPRRQRPQVHVRRGQRSGIQQRREGTSGGCRRRSRHDARRVATRVRPFLPGRYAARGRRIRPGPRDRQARGGTRRRLDRSEQRAALGLALRHPLAGGQGRIGDERASLIEVPARSGAERLTSRLDGRDRARRVLHRIAARGAAPRSVPYDIPFSVIEGDILLPVDRIVTCVMVVWAVTIFAGMSYLAAVL